MLSELLNYSWVFFKICYVFIFFLLHRAASEAYGSSPARDRIRAIAAGLRHSHSNARSDPSLVCDPHHSSRQCRILNPLSEARD